MARDPGQTFRTAKAFQIGATSRSVRNSLGAKDQIDLWKISPTTRSSFNLTLSGIAKKANANVELLNSARQVIAFSKRRGNKAEALGNSILEPGTYYIRVTLQPRSVGTRYALAMSATPVTDLFGNSFETATRLTTTAATGNDFVGNADPNDFFVFNPLVAGQFKVDLTGLSDDANLALYGGDRTLLATSKNMGALDETLNQSLTDIAGSTYYLQVSQAPGKDTNYNLSYSYTAAPITTTPTGLGYIDLAPGTGATPIKGQTVTVQYTGILENGAKFGSSRDRNQPFAFKIGTRQVIKGWDEGISTMRVGGRRQLIIPADLAYEDRAQGIIPPNATLIFDIELIGIG